MRILQINSAANVGSTGRIAEGIGKELLSRSHESYIAYGRRAGKSTSSLIKIGTSLDVYVHGAFSLLWDAHGLASKQATRSFLRQLEELQPNLVHLHNIHGYYLNYPLLFDCLHKLDLPVVWTFHDTWPFTGHCAYFDRFQCKKWQTECSACPMKSYYPRTLWDKSTRNFRLKREVFSRLKRMAIVTPSDWLTRHVGDSFLKHYPCVTVNNGIDLDTFRPRCEKSRTPLVLGVASAWPESKGLADFIRLRDLLPNNYRIVLVGLSPKQAKSLPPGIEVVLRTDSTEQLAEWYSRATIFANPTYTDNFPTTNLEALACGTPVLTYNTGGSPEAVSKETGAVIETGDYVSLARAIQHWTANVTPTTLDACRQRALDRYSDRHKLAEYVDLYARLLARSPEH
jgi:putative colanic acid biosynthesis glycosyltransferase